MIDQPFKSKVPVSAAILAGGKSSRMGEDKGLMEIAGKAMIEHVIDPISEITTEIVIVANSESYARFGYPVVPDEFHEKGPMAGIYTALKNSKHGHCFILSCDVPGITAGALHHLLSSRETEDITIAAYKGSAHPLIGIYSKGCMPVIAKKISEDQLKVTGIFDELQVRIVNMDAFDAGNFRNINTREDL